MLVQRVHQIAHAVPGKERQDRIITLLQMFIRIDQPRHIAGIGAGPFVALQRFARGLALHLRKLIRDLRQALIGGCRERGVESRQIVAQLFHRFGYRATHLAEFRGQGGRYQLLGDRRAHSILAMEKRGDRESIALHQFGRAQVQQRESTARHHHRHPPQELAIQHLGLRHVRQFGWTADIGHGWQHVVLHHRPQQRIGRQLFRAIHQFRR